MNFFSLMMNHPALRQQLQGQMQPQIGGPMAMMFRQAMMQQQPQSTGPTAGLMRTAVQNQRMQQPTTSMVAGPMAQSYGQMFRRQQQPMQQPTMPNAMNMPERRFAGGRRFSGNY